jgi:pimeloyl-ACP methyl ester carboxylesterase
MSMDAQPRPRSILRGARRPVAIAAAALVVLGAGLASALAATHASGALPASHFVRAACSPQLPPDIHGARCGYLVVPENRATVSAKTIRLAVAIIPAKRRHPAATPLVFFTGGPGANAMSDADLLVEAGLNSDRRVVVVSQRGTYSSSPRLVCPSIDNYRARSVGHRFLSVANRRGTARAAATCRKQLARRGIDVAAYNTTENAADMADLRVALHIKRWDVLSHSYGTELALTYMRRFPAGVRSVILDGTVPPSVASLGWTWPSFRESFSNILRACRAQRSCRDRYPHTGRTFTRLVNRLEAHPVITRVKNPIGSGRVRVSLDGGVLVNWLTRQSHFSPTIPREIDELAHGHPRPIAEDWAGARILPPAARGHFAHGLSYSVWCSEWIPYESRRNQLRQAREAFPGFPHSVLAQAPQLTYLRSICRAWHVPAASRSIRRVTHSAIPTLAITGTFDAQTGAQWGAYAARTLSHSTVVELPGVAHGTYDNPCGSEVVRSFLRRLRSPDTRCVRRMRPRPFEIGPR